MCSDKVTRETVTKPIASLRLDECVLPLHALVLAPVVVTTRDVNGPFGSNTYLCAEVHRGSCIAEDVGFYSPILCMNLRYSTTHYKGDDDQAKSQLGSHFLLLFVRVCVAFIQLCNNWLANLFHYSIISKYIYPTFALTHTKYPPLFLKCSTKCKQCIFVNYNKFTYICQ